MNSWRTDNDENNKEGLLLYSYSGMTNHNQLWILQMCIDLRVFWCALFIKLMHIYKNLLFINVMWDIFEKPNPKFTHPTHTSPSFYRKPVIQLQWLGNREKQLMEIAQDCQHVCPAASVRYCFHFVTAALKMQSEIYLAIQSLIVFKFDFSWIMGLNGFCLKS